jgi:hypothetical protein
MSRGNSFTRSIATRVAPLSVALVSAAILLASLASTASAEIYGEVGTAWGTAGAGQGQLFKPGPFGVDTDDGSVFVLDVAESSEFARVQKFSGTGVYEAGVQVPTPLEGSSRRAFMGIAVDTQLNRLYLLQYKNQADTVNSSFAAQQILVFSTVPNGEAKLVAPSGGPATLPVPDPAGLEPLDAPSGFALDPSNGDLVILAQTRAAPTVHKVVQRVSSSGVIGARFEDTGDLLDPVGSETSGGFGVGPDGTTYGITGSTSLWEKTKAWKLPPSLTSIEAVPGFEAAVAAEEKHSGIETGGFPLASGAASKGGPQLAVSADGDTIYWRGRWSQSTNTVAGFAFVYGYSISDRATRFSYGSEVTGSCQIKTGQGTASASIATDGDELIVFDSGPPVASPAYGVKVLKFAPGGSGCPDPKAALRLKSGADEVSSVPAGTTVTLDASPSELKAATLEQLTWKVEGPEAFTTPVSGGVMTLDHQFNQAGTYTVRLNLRVAAASAYGRSSTAKAKTLTVQTPIPPPAVSALSPTSGPTAGGNQVEVTGTDLGSATKVEFGTTVVNAPFTEGTATKIKLNAPAHAAGSVDVRVTTAGGTSANTLADDYAYVTPMHQVSVAKTGSGSGTVTSAPAGLDCGITCTASFVEGATVTLTATVAAGSTFTGWGGACAGTGNTCVVPAAGPRSVTANFDAVPAAKTCATDPSLCPPSEEKPTNVKPKPLKCKKDFKKQKVKGKLKCVKVRKHAKKSTHGFSLGSWAREAL